jgi:hypothetical protein
VEIVKDGRRKVFIQDSDWLNFEITELGERGGTWYGKERGIFRPHLQWETELVENGASVADMAGVPVTEMS